MLKVSITWLNLLASLIDSCACYEYRSWIIILGHGFGGCLNKWCYTSNCCWPSHCCSCGGFGDSQKCKLIAKLWHTRNTNRQQHSSFLYSESDLQTGETYLTLLVCVNLFTIFSKCSGFFGFCALVRSLHYHLFLQVNPCSCQVSQAFILDSRWKYPRAAC